MTPLNKRKWLPRYRVRSLVSAENLSRVSRAVYLRDLLRELVLRDLKLRYKRSVLGIAWSLILPLMQLIVFTIVFRRILPIRVDNYPTYLFSGLVPWTWFSASLIGATAAITDNRELVKRPGFPAAILPVVAVLTNFIHFGLALPILFSVVVLFDRSLTWVVVALPAIVVVQALFSVGLGYLLATVQVTFRDTQHLLTIVLQLLFYLTPIFYDHRAAPEQYQWIFRLNPLLYLLEGYRAMFLGRPPLPILPLTGIFIVSCCLVWFGYRVFGRASAAFVEEL